METAVYESFYHYNRNYGCRVHEVTWNGFQTLVVENERVRVSILVEKGTDIVELLYKPMDIDFMWKSPLEVDAETYRNPITRSMDAGNFLDAYEGGWQELLPTITSPTNYQDMGLGFHGEMIFLPWKYSILEDSPYEVKIRFQVRMKRAPLFVTKDLTLRSGKSVLEFEETIRNDIIPLMGFLFWMEIV
ncbi:MAG: hypothetical protein NTX88_00860 [Candidatus Atribacteria bacterium]|nr:hypothetical protein [Candidatus Atribacteria bacterium]